MDHSYSVLLSPNFLHAYQCAKREEDKLQTCRDEKCHKWAKLYNEIVGYQCYLKKDLEKPVDCSKFREGKELSCWHLVEIQALYTCQYSSEVMLRIKA